ncbi:uncharacterized protein E5676_scaffold130G00630 [Cucumis melo var. makuwa]|uniref:Uncharacterized protein n=1 Tax=Cucumis melo var. makuwa TaxID=1194695 RepID=A0A5D3CYW9_CUCMM|nr:uncharacterized protein E5676_scaffold130G00630 [Cucumis melo var. makuwa]
MGDQVRKNTLPRSSQNRQRFKKRNKFRFLDFILLAHETSLRVLLDIISHIGPEVVLFQQSISSLFVSSARNNDTSEMNFRNYTDVPQSTGSTASDTKTHILGAIARMPQSLVPISVDGKNLWILDSGAADHLIGNELEEDDRHCSVSQS